MPKKLFLNLHTLSARNLVHTFSKVIFLSVLNLNAAEFSSGSTGAAGELNVTTPGSYFFGCNDENQTLNPEGNYIYNFTNIYIAKGATLKLSALCINAPVVFLASGNVTIDGDIDLTGGTGPNLWPDAAAARLPTIPGSGGFPGGLGGLNTIDPDYGPLFEYQKAGAGPGGGIAAISTTYNTNGAGGDAVHATPMLTDNVGSGGIYGNSFNIPLMGGSGGGGGRPYCYTGSCVYNTPFEGRIIGLPGGAGGGAILIASSKTITLNGTIRADGGNARKFSADQMGVGNGSAGAVRLVANSIFIDDSGIPNAPYRKNIFADPVRLEANLFSFDGKTFLTRDQPYGYGSWVSPQPLNLPTESPQIFIKRIDTNLVDQHYVGPWGQLNIQESEHNAMEKYRAINFELEARDIPLNADIFLTIVPDGQLSRENMCSPLVGTFAKSLSTCSVDVRKGFSVGYAHATWNPN